MRKHDAIDALRQTRDDSGISARQSGGQAKPNEGRRVASAPYVERETAKPQNKTLVNCGDSRERPALVPLVAGGQGRSGKEVEAAGWIGVVWWLGCLGLGIASLRWLFS